MFVHPPLVNDPLHNAIRLADWAELNILLEEEETISVEKITYSLEEIPPDASDDSEDREYFHDRSAERAENAFMELNARYSWLGFRYPLKIDRGVAMLHRESRARDIYRFLIILRARQMYRDQLGDDGEQSGLLFEEVVPYALGAYIAASSGNQVRFGVAGGQRGSGLPHSPDQSLQNLSLRMHEAMGVVPSGGNRDFGADAIVWKQFGDDRPGQLVMVGQATISEGEWMHRNPPKRWTDRQPLSTRLIHFLARPLTAVAFVETLSLTPRDTLAGLTSQSIPFDRLRLLSVLSDESLPSDLRKSMNDWSDHMKRNLPL